MNVVALIPARGGSKGIPGKNILSCAGKPLIAHTIEAGRGSRRLTRLIVSTDDPEVAEVCRGLGAEVPFLRPAGLAEDESPMLSVMAHALDWLEKAGPSVDALVLLQPTSPLRRGEHIDGAVDLFFSSKAETVVSVVRVPHQFSPVSVMEMSGGRLSPYLKDRPMPLRRQDKPLLYARNGPAVLVEAPSVLRRGSLYGDPTLGYEMGMGDSLDVDTMEDFRMAEQALRAKGGKP